MGVHIQNSAIKLLHFVVLNVIWFSKQISG